MWRTDERTMHIQMDKERKKRRIVLRLLFRERKEKIEGFVINRLGPAHSRCIYPVRSAVTACSTRAVTNWLFTFRIRIGNLFFWPLPAEHNDVQHKFDRTCDVLPSYHYIILAASKIDRAFPACQTTHASIEKVNSCSSSFYHATKPNEFVLAQIRTYQCVWWTSYGEGM